MTSSLGAQGPTGSPAEISSGLVWRHLGLGRRGKRQDRDPGEVQSTGLRNLRPRKPPPPSTPLSFCNVLPAVLTGTEHAWEPRSASPEAVAGGFVVLCVAQSRTIPCSSLPELLQGSPEHWSVCLQFISYLTEKLPDPET